MLCKTSGKIDVPEFVITVLGAYAGVRNRMDDQLVVRRTSSNISSSDVSFFTCIMCQIDGLWVGEMGVASPRARRVHCIRCYSAIVRVRLSSCYIFLGFSQMVVVFTF